MAPIVDERDPAVRALIGRGIRVAHACGRKVGLCGQAPSDYTEFAAFLVRQGIDSISPTPDALFRATLTVLEAERSVPRRRVQPTTRIGRHAADGGAGASVAAGLLA
jgi:pyruvate,water dikinase